MAIEISGPPCSFCGATALQTPSTTGSAAGSFIHCSQDIPDTNAPGYWHQPDGDSRYRALIALCPAHSEELHAAGAQGLVFPPTGARWWLDGSTT